MNILKIIFLFLAVWMTLINTTRVYYKINVDSLNFILWAIGIVGFVAIQFKLV